jgi:splicing factor U2AF subunit
MDEEALYVLMSNFGALKSLVVGRGPDRSHKGFAHVEYADFSVTDQAISVLNGLEVMPGKCLTVTRAKSGPPGSSSSQAAPAAQPDLYGLLASAAAAAAAVAGLGVGVGAGGAAAAAAAAAAPPPLPPQPAAQMTAAQAVVAVSGKVLCLDNMVTAEEVKDEAGFKDLLEDVSSECSKYGKLHVVVSVQAA